MPDRVIRTDLAGKFFRSDTIRIRKGDSLLLTATGTGTTLAMDAHGDGVYEFSGMPGDRFPALFDTPGTYAAKAKMDGVEIGSLMIHVLDADIHKPIACEVGFQREKNVVISPITQRTSVIFTTNDSYLMDESEKGAFSNTDGQGTAIYLKAKKRGTPILLARLPGVNGAMVACKEIDEFTRDTPALETLIINADMQSGATKLTMRPYVPDIRWQFNMFASTSTFAGGVTSLSINTSDFNPITGEPFFTQVFDSATGETVGEYLFDIEVPDGESKYCFTATPNQSASKEVKVGEAAPVNGDPCKIRVNELRLCQGDKGNLQIEVVEKSGNKDKHKVQIVGDGAKFTAAKIPGVDCSTGIVEPKDPEVEGVKVGTYDVKIGNTEKDSTTWKDAILVVSKSGLTVFPKKAELCLGKKRTFSAYKCVGGKVQAAEVNWTLDKQTFVNFDGMPPAGPASTVTLKTVAAGGPSKLTAFLGIPETQGYLEDNASITVCDFSLSPNELLLCPGDAESVRLVQSPAGKVKINVLGGTISGKTKIKIFDGAKDVTNESIDVDANGKYLTVKINKDYGLDIKDGEAVFIPGNSCEAKKLKIEASYGKSVRPMLVEQCKAVNGNSAEFFAFSCGADEKSHAEAVDWSLSNDIDFISTPSADKQLTVVTLKPGKNFGTTKVVAKKGGAAFAEATYTVYTIEFTQKADNVCARQSAVFKAASKPAGKNVFYSIETPALGCSIVADGKFTAGNKYGVVKVKAELEGHSECAVTTDVNVHLLTVALAPSVICNKFMETSQATANLNGNDAAVAWSLATPNDGKITIDAATGRIFVNASRASGSYTIKATHAGTGCTGTATLDLVSAQFYKNEHCQGFYAQFPKGLDPDAIEDTLMVGAGLKNTVLLDLEGNGSVYLVPENPALCSVSKPSGGIQNMSGVTVEVKGGTLPAGEKFSKTKILARLGSELGPICKTLDVYVLKPVSLKVKCRVVKGADGSAPPVLAGDYDLGKMQAVSNEVWRPQAAVTFTFVGPIDEGSINIKLTDPCTDEQRKAMIAQCGSLGAGVDAVQRLMFLVKGIENEGARPDGLAEIVGKYSWMTSRVSTTLVVPHELGHNFGLDHDPHKDNELMKEAALDVGDCVLTIKDVLQISR
jgi:hypothetical protein